LPPEVWEETLSETELHLLVLHYLVGALRWFLRLREDACVEGNMAVQFDPDDLRRHLSPDVFVTLGVPREPPRRSYATWVEGKGLDLVFEITSASSRDEDTGSKLAKYQDTLGVHEYVLFDPFGEYLNPRLQIYRRRERKLVPVEVHEDCARLKTLELDVLAIGRELRLRDRRTGELIPSYDECASARTELAVELAKTEALTAELGERAREAEAHAREARDQAREALARAERLEEEIRRLRGGNA
jgi:Uma2 family endonuclease